MKYSMIQDL